MVGIAIYLSIGLLVSAITYYLCYKTYPDIIRTLSRSRAAEAFVIYFWAATWPLVIIRAIAVVVSYRKEV